MPFQGYHCALPVSEVCINYYFHKFSWFPHLNKSSNCSRSCWVVVSSVWLNTSATFFWRVLPLVSVLHRHWSTAEIHASDISMESTVPHIHLPRSYWPYPKNNRRISLPQCIEKNCKVPWASVATKESVSELSELCNLQGPGLTTLWDNFWMWLDGTETRLQGCTFPTLQ